MNLKNLTRVFLFCVLLSSCTKKAKEDSMPVKAEAIRVMTTSLTTGAVYHIPAGTITDHSDPTIIGSIAWYFAQYGRGNTYNLSTSASTAVYQIKKKLVIPPNSVLGEDSTVNAAIQPSSAWNDSIMVLMNNDTTTIQDIEINGLFRAKQIISGNGNHVSLLYITAHRSQKVDDAHVIVFSTAKNVTIRNCLLRRASCDTEIGFTRKADLIYTRNCDTVTIKNNDMAIAASSGINYSGSINVTIAGNQISDVGRADIPEYISDGITSYHLNLGYLYQNVWITSNEIWNSRNHGIHVSGRDIHIEGNKIYNCGLGTDTLNKSNNISVGDWRTTPYAPDCSSNITVKNNTFPNCPGVNHDRPSIHISGPYKPGTVTVSGNTFSGSCTTVQWDTANTCQ